MKEIDKIFLTLTMAVFMFLCISLPVNFMVEERSVTVGENDYASYQVTRVKQGYYYSQTMYQYIKFEIKELKFRLFNDDPSKTYSVVLLDRRI